MIRKINKAYKFRFYPDKRQEEVLNRELNNARFVWNYLLFAAKVVYNSRKESIDLSKTLTEMKKLKEFSFLQESSTVALQQKRMDLETAYKNLFRRLRQGKVGLEAGFPKFKSKIGAQSVRYQLNQRNIHNIYCSGEFIRPTKDVGKIEFKWTKIPNGIPKMLTITKDPSGSWWLSFSCEEEVNINEPTSQSPIGIDFGMKVFATLSNGLQFKHPLSFAKAKAKLAKAQRVLSRKTKGSKRRLNQRLKVAKLHSKIANQRRDYIHKFTNLICNNFDVISVETLDIKSMQQKFGKGFNSKLADVSIYETVRQLEYKSFWRGRQLVKIDKWFPSSKLCNICGSINAMPLSQRTMNCSCGNCIDRDLNASINILGEGLRSLDVEVDRSSILWNRSYLRPIEASEILCRKVVLTHSDTTVLFQDRQ